MPDLIYDCDFLPEELVLHGDGHIHKGTGLSAIPYFRYSYKIVRRKRYNSAISYDLVFS